ncbi:endoribonuclease YbeY [Spirochaetia bacterium]|nr:endoribonuclease YbeY [Spirochaetia bacterium]
MNRVEISLEGVESPSWLDGVSPFVLAVLDKLEKCNWDLSLLLCDNGYIRSLNKQYRSLDEPTDVLSFTLGETGGDRYQSGDIVISLDMLAENAVYFKVSPDEELRRLIIHGILHLGGMDHVSNDSEEPMLRLQERLLQELSHLSIITQEQR